MERHPVVVGEQALAGLVEHFGIATSEGDDSSLVVVSNEAELASPRKGVVEKRSRRPCPTPNSTRRSSRSAKR